MQRWRHSRRAKAVQRCNSGFAACKSAKVKGKMQGSRGDREPDDWLGRTFTKVTGDSHQGIGLSGVSCSAFGSRLRVPAADGRKAET